MVRLICGLAATLAVLSPYAAASGQPEDGKIESVAKLFEAESATGSLVVVSSDGRQRYLYNEARANERLSPASTFKIVNTLIALDSGVVMTRASRFTWDGTDRGISAWNRDQTLASAFRVSCVWCYQQIAREVGRAKYASELARIGYGNGRIGEPVDRFWLDGTLRISAIEQVRLVKAVQDYSIPYRRDHVDELKAIMLDEESSDYRVYAKTGWTGGKLHVGWYVGFVEKGDETWIFAMNMHMDKVEQAPLRKELTLRSLRALGIL